MASFTPKAVDSFKRSSANTAQNNVQLKHLPPTIGRIPLLNTAICFFPLYLVLVAIKSAKILLSAILF